MGRKAKAPSSRDAVGVENSNGRATQPVFKVKRKTRNGETLELTLSSLSPFFALQLPIAAGKLGTSPSSLKKACRFLGFNRWPGRKVRGLESTIDGLQRALVGLQGTESEAAGLRAAIPTLQQELDELCHGPPQQIENKMHSPTLVMKNAYRRLYQAHGWRSKYHKFGRQNISASNINMGPETQIGGEDGAADEKGELQDEGATGGGVGRSDKRREAEVESRCAKCGTLILQPDIFSPALVKVEDSMDSVW